MDGGSLPPGNLVSALIALETNRDRSRLPALLDTLIELLRAQDDEELTDAFTAWVAQELLPRPLRGTASAPLPSLEEVRTMLAETVQEWTEQWVEKGIEQGRAQGIEQGRAQGLEQGRVEERALLCRQAARKLDADAGQQLAAALADVTDPGRLAQVGDWITGIRRAGARRRRGDAASGPVRPSDFGGFRGCQPTAAETEQTPSRPRGSSGPADGDAGRGGRRGRARGSSTPRRHLETSEAAALMTAPVWTAPRARHSSRSARPRLSTMGVSR